MADQSVIDQFMSITGADAQTARFFLNAANNNQDEAVSTFFETGGILPPSAPTAPAAARSAPQPQPPAVTPSPAPSRARAANSSIATLGGLRPDQDDDDDDAANNYYAGGEKSGQMIQDPRKRDEAAGSSSRDNDAPSDIAEAIFERARARGPRTDEERRQFGEQNFTGAGYRLGDDIAAREPQTRPTVVGRRNITRNLTFYANGFTIDEGELRGYDDPNNERFLADVNRGVVPREMEEPGVGDVSITLIDKKGETYVAPKKKIVPFSGSGQRLTSAASSSSAPVGEVNAAAASNTLSVDESRPVTSVQIRLSDGTRLVARVNEDSNVGQLRNFVRSSRPGVGDFTLSTTFPRVLLNDDEKTIKDAGLKGAVVVQTLK